MHDFVILCASVRRGGRSLAEIAREEIGPSPAPRRAIAILFIIVIALAGLGLVVVNALADSAWGTFTIGATIPIALAHGPLHVPVRRQGAIAEATAIGVVAAARWPSCSASGSPSRRSRRWFIAVARASSSLAIAAYGFIASVLPVWMLLCPRDYLSTFMKIGTIAAPGRRRDRRQPELQMPALTQFVDGGGPDLPGQAVPVRVHHHRVRRDLGLPRADRLGHHAQDDRPRARHPDDRLRRDAARGLRRRDRADRRRALHPGDYFAINVRARDVRDARHASGQPGRARSAQVGEDARRAAPAARSRSRSAWRRSSPACPGCAGLMTYWYHFAIMFEALFILTTIDTGTRVARFLLQEFAGRLYAAARPTDWLPGASVDAGRSCSRGGTSSIRGASRRSGRCSASRTSSSPRSRSRSATIVLVNLGRTRYAWVTVCPMAFVAVTTLTAGLPVRDNFWPMTSSPEPATRLQGFTNSTLTAHHARLRRDDLVAAAPPWLRARSGVVPAVASDEA